MDIRTRGVNNLTLFVGDITDIDYTTFAVLEHINI